MSSLCENLKYSYENFKQYAQHGTVPAVEKNNSQVPQNCFYKSVHHIDSVVGPVKDMLVGVNKDADTSTTTLGKREKKVCGVAYLTYLPVKLISHLKGTDGPKSLLWYTNNLQNKAEQHGETCAKFLSLVLSYIISAVIWAAALIITPLTWAVDKVASKFSDAKSEAADSNGKAPLLS
ncbi:hypothetical protein FQR65_LT18903 [Abscondita terminalis]|nr:hypothetical protein FQR65_LT18903 [Abscondita terminalis]